MQVELQEKSGKLSKPLGILSADRVCNPRKGVETWWASFERLPLMSQQYLDSPSKMSGHDRLWYLELSRGWVSRSVTLGRYVKMNPQPNFTFLFFLKHVAKVQLEEHFILMKQWCWWYSECWIKTEQWCRWWKKYWIPWNLMEDWPLVGKIMQSSIQPTQESCSDLRGSRIQDGFCSTCWSTWIFDIPERHSNRHQTKNPTWLLWSSDDELSQPRHLIPRHPVSGRVDHELSTWRIIPYRWGWLDPLMKDRDKPRVLYYWLTNSYHNQPADLFFWFKNPLRTLPTFPWLMFDTQDRGIILWLRVDLYTKNCTMNYLIESYPYPFLQTNPPWLDCNRKEEEYINLGEVQVAVSIFSSQTRYSTTFSLISNCLINPPSTVLYPRSTKTLFNYYKQED